MQRLRNTTSFPDAVLKTIEAAVMPPGGVGAYDLEVRNSTHRSVHGKAYWAGSSYHSTARPFIVLNIGTRRYPSPPKGPRQPGYLPEPWYADKTEEVVRLFAHELRHLWQARVPKGRRVWGSRGRFSERDADAYSLRALRAWRTRSPHQPLYGDPWTTTTLVA